MSERKDKGKNYYKENIIEKTHELRLFLDIYKKFRIADTKESANEKTKVLKSMGIFSIIFSTLLKRIVTESYIISEFLVGYHKHVSSDIQKIIAELINDIQIGTKYIKDKNKIDNCSIKKLRNAYNHCEQNNEVIEIKTIQDILDRIFPIINMENKKVYYSEDLTLVDDYKYFWKFLYNQQKISEDLRNGKIKTKEKFIQRHKNIDNIDWEYDKLI